VIYDYTVSLFTGEHVSADARGTRKLTAVEVSLSSKMPFNGGIGSGSMVPIIRNLRLKEEVRLSHSAWNKDYIAASDNRPGLETYLTTERLDALTNLMKTKNSSAILIFKDNVMLLRLDLPDPLDNAEKIDRLLKMMTKAASALELNPDEDKKLKAAVAQKPAREVSLNMPEGAPGLQLEIEDEKPA
jgi:hypothetical protein